VCSVSSSSSYIARVVVVVVASKFVSAEAMNFCNKLSCMKKERLALHQISKREQHFCVLYIIIY